MESPQKRYSFTIEIPYCDATFPYVGILSATRYNGSIAEILWTGICSAEIDQHSSAFGELDVRNSPFVSFRCQLSNPLPRSNGYTHSVLRKMVVEIIPNLTPKQRGQLFCVGVDAFGGVDKVYSLINAKKKPISHELPSGVRIINGSDKNTIPQSVVEVGQPREMAEPVNSVNESLVDINPTSDATAVKPTASSDTASEDIINIGYNAPQPEHPNTVPDEPTQLSQPDITKSPVRQDNDSAHINSTQRDKPYINLGDTQNTPNISGNIDFNEHAGQPRSREPISFLKGKFPI